MEEQIAVLKRLNSGDSETVLQNFIEFTVVLSSIHQFEVTKIVFKLCFLILIFMKKGIAPSNKRLIETPSKKKKNK